ncbi:MAG: (S)-sulfolactate dehydrogenase [Verrucomicrobiae bacterium]|nr:(S)-sulfolactate dehydrogenase [Verrucomicrobiae bacterium]
MLVPKVLGSLPAMRPRGIFLLDQNSAELIYGPEQHTQIAELVEVTDRLDQAEVIFSGWGAPVMDEKFLADAPAVKAVFYGAGTIRGFVTEAFWQRGIVVTSAYAANAVPVAEYTLATTLLSLKKFWQQRGLVRAAAVPGAYRSTVGIISLGMVGREVWRRLQHHDLQLIAFDPFTKPAGIEMVSLAEVFRRADVVTLHTPNLPETRGMITGEHFAMMKPGATFINTARGAIIRENELIDVLRQRPDLTAVLDVTNPEPPAPDSPLRTLPNVILTPHIAGSMGAECRRMGQYMVEELRRYLAGKPLQWQITKDKAALLA